MEGWFEQQLGEIERQIVSSAWGGKAARTIVAQRSYPTQIEDLWDAIVTPDRLRRWFLPVNGELSEGGTYQLEGNAGGRIIRCEAPHSLAVTWEMHGDVGWVDVTLEEINEQSTRLTLEHMGLESETFLDFWKQFGPGSMGVGWDLTLTSLAEHLINESDTFMSDQTAWIQTGAGRNFLQSSSDRWAVADIAFGTDSKAAHDSGTRSMNFYAGIEE